MKWYEKQKEKFAAKMNDEAEYTTEENIEEGLQDKEADSTHNVMLNEIMEDSLQEYAKPYFEETSSMQEETITPTTEEIIVAPATCCIGVGTKIEGNITSDDYLIIDGNVIGQVSCAQKVEINGQVQGDIECASAILKISTITGNITSHGSVEMAQGCVVNGFIHATSLFCAGEIFGDVSVTGTLSLEGKGIVNGDVRASDLEIVRGAKIKGNVSID